jgi:hypothetical protein
VVSFCRYCLLTACGACVALLAVCYYQASDCDSHATPGLVVPEPEQTLPALACGKPHEVEFRVINQSGQTRRIIGVLYG